jgi:DNA-binding NarL/FixJ family response regulator
MSLRDLYRRSTNEEPPSERKLKDALASLHWKTTKFKRRVAIVTAYASGESVLAIAKRFKIEPGTVRSTSVLAMRTVRKTLLSLPRYHNVGR